MGTPYGKLPILFPYHSHNNPQRYGNGMGLVWEAYHKGLPLLGVPGITIDLLHIFAIISSFESSQVLEARQRPGGRIWCERFRDGVATQLEGTGDRNPKLRGLIAGLGVKFYWWTWH